MSIRSRLTVAYGIGVIVTLSIVGLVVWWEMGGALRGSLETAIGTRANGVLVSLENAGQSGIQEGDHSAPGTFAALFSPDGALIDASSDAPNGIRPLDGVLDAAGRSYLVQTVSAPDGTLVVAGADLRSVTAAQADLARILLVVGLSVGAASLLGGWLLAGRTLRPLRRLIDEAETFGAGDLDRRLTPPLRMDEVGRLTVALNAMIERIAESVERQRLFVAMASHELRTPLAALRAELDIVDRADASLSDYREALHEAQGDAIRLTNLSTSLLQLAESATDRDTVARSSVRLRELIGTAVRGLEPLTRQRRATVELDAPDDVVWVDRTRIEHALGNLVTNAILHGGAGPVEIRCRVHDETEPRTLVVEVLDRGPGLGDDRPEDLFVPFRRGSGASGAGSGLGLATVASAARAHGGAVGAMNREGGGARFWFEVPCDSTTVGTQQLVDGPDPVPAKTG